jgi:hypothetical protein
LADWLEVLTGRHNQKQSLGFAFLIQHRMACVRHLWQLAASVLMGIERICTKYGLD